MPTVRSTSRYSLAGRMALALAVLALICAPVAILAARWLDSLWYGSLVGLITALPLSLWLAQRVTQRWLAVIDALRNGLESLNDQDYSVSVAGSAEAELADVVGAYNKLGDTLRRERLGIYQRELLLDTVIQATPVAMILTNPGDAVLYSNVAARQLLHQGRKLEGHRLAPILAQAPAPLRDALAVERDSLCTMELAGNSEVMHVSQRRFALNAQPHRLILLKPLTRELAAQESQIWKKVIRVIAHELNNSLAPISSLAHSGQLLAARPDTEQLLRVFRTIEERAAHLASFIDGYARFSKLPRPQLKPLQWPAVADRLQLSSDFRLLGTLPAQPLMADAAQLEQMLINLLKNARESGSPAEQVTLQVQLHGAQWLIEVGDRGQGLLPEVLANALLPFYSTKATGGGVGLTLCREIIEAHGGRLSIANREGGGAMVTVWLPQLAS